MENIIKILEEEPDILLAYLFGSYAKGTQNETSDIDIAIFLIDESLLEREPLYPSRLAIKIENNLSRKREWMSGFSMAEPSGSKARFSDMENFFFPEMRKNE